jgi:hypothetical protein
MIFDMMLQPDRAGPAFSALFDLNMKLINPQARVFAMNEVHDLLAATDRYIDIQTTDLPHTPYAMVTARKAAQ